MVPDIISPKNIALFNENLRYESPEDIIQFALQYAKNPLVTTSFGAHSAAILYATTQIKKDIQVVWCDTGYNTEATQRHASHLIEKLNLNVDVFSPLTTFFNVKSADDLKDMKAEEYSVFSEAVKLEPFKRAMKKHKPDVWFTTIRKNQSSYRNTLDILSITKEGVLKVSPFYYFTDNQIKAYLKKHKLPVEYNYFDPVKALGNKECGIQLLN